MKLGAHIQIKELNPKKLLAALVYIQTGIIKDNVKTIGNIIINENGLETAINEIEKHLKM